jgi:hypothetical protein
LEPSAAFLGFLSGRFVRMAKHVVRRRQNRRGKTAEGAAAERLVRTAQSLTKRTFGSKGNTNGLGRAPSGSPLFGADCVFQALTRLSSDLGGANVVKMECEVLSGLLSAYHANVKNTLALEAK